VSRSAPRPVGFMLDDLTRAIAPASTLARIQERWESAVGPAIAAAARPAAERNGVLTVLCESAVWAQELDLMGAELAERLNGALDDGEPGPGPIRELRCRYG
jgi:predicted nucleic acid-binding Zn ribbon protein